MKTLTQKINSEAARICRVYINVLARGLEPALLTATIQANRWDILSNIADGRVNQADTLEKVRSIAHYEIKCALAERPDLARLLVDFRKQRQMRDRAEDIATQSKWQAIA